MFNISLAGHSRAWAALSPCLEGWVWLGSLSPGWGSAKTLPGRAQLGPLHIFRAPLPWKGLKTQLHQGINSLSLLLGSSGHHWANLPAAWTPQWFPSLESSACPWEPTILQGSLTRLSAPDSSSSSPLGSSRNWITLTLFRLVSVQLSSTLFCRRFSGEEQNTVGAPFGKSLDGVSSNPIRALLFYLPTASEALWTKAVASTSRHPPSLSHQTSSSLYRGVEASAPALPKAELRQECHADRTMKMNCLVSRTLKDEAALISWHEAIPQFEQSLSQPSKSPDVPQERQPGTEVPPQPPEHQALQCWCRFLPRLGEGCWGSR